MPTSSPDLRDALGRYGAAVVERVRENGIELPIPERTSGWVSRGDGYFALRPTLESLESETDAVIRDARDLPEHAVAVEAVKADPRVSKRVDELVGTTIGGRWRVESDNVPGLFVWRLLRYLNGASLDDALARAFDEFERWVLRDSEPHIAIAPLAGVVADDAPIALGDNCEIDVMTDTEVIACLTVQAIQGMGPAGFVRVDPDAAAVRIRQTLPIVVGEIDDMASEVQKTWEKWQSCVEEAVHMLRLFKGGSIGCPAIVDFSENPWSVSGYRFMPAPTPPPRSTRWGFRNYHIAAGEGHQLAELWRQLHDPETLARPGLQTALRRFGLLGERERAEDRLVDLMIAAEALYLPGEHDESAFKLALRAAVFVDDADRSLYDRFLIMNRAYGARSRLAHGERLKTLRMPPDDAPTTLAAFNEVVSEYLRRALLAGVKRSGATVFPTTSDGWNRLVLEAVDEIPKRRPRT